MKQEYEKFIATICICHGFWERNRERETKKESNPRHRLYQSTKNNDQKCPASSTEFNFWKSASVFYVYFEFFFPFYILVRIYEREENQ